MLANRRVSQIRSKFVTRYLSIFYTKDFASNLRLEQWTEIILLPIEEKFLEHELVQLSRDSCLDGAGTVKPALNSIVAACLDIAEMAGDETKDQVVSNALVTLSIVVRSMNAKNLSGFEYMEVLAGGVESSDRIFTKLTGILDRLLGTAEILADIRHKVLQLALIFTSTVGQLSPGAYFLQRDLFPSTILFVKDPNTGKFSFEALLLISSLSNFHKSDAAKLNPYLRRVKECTDDDFMRKLCWSSNYAISTVIKTYQDIFDDSPPPRLGATTIVSSVGSFFTSLRPDRVISRLSDPPRDAFNSQPIEACVIMLSIYEFLRMNRAFSSILIEQVSALDTENLASQNPPFSFTIITLCSYLVTHASSSSSPRALAYANLSLNVLLALAENADFMDVLSKPSKYDIRLCRQRLPLLPLSSPSRAPVCALLDCCVLWLRHNLQKKLEVASYTTCIWTCHRVIWYLQNRHIRLDYNWLEFLSAVLALLEFLSTKLHLLVSTGGIENLIRQTIALLDMSILKCETFLPTPESVHEFIYELVRSSAMLQRQPELLSDLSLGSAVSQRETLQAAQSSSAMQHILDVVTFYEAKVMQANVHTAATAIKVVSVEVEANGLHSVNEPAPVEEPAVRCEDILGFARFASADILSLMP